MNRQPGREATKISHHTAILARHQCEDATERQAPIVDETCDVACTEIFRDAAVDGNAAFLAVSLEQIGLEGWNQGQLGRVNETLQSNMLRVCHAVIERVAGEPGQQLNRAKIAGCVEQRIVRYKGIALRLPMLRVAFAHHLTAGHLVGFSPALRPLVASYRFDQQLQSLRVFQEFAEPVFIGLADESVGVGYGRPLPEDLDDVVVSQRIEMQRNDRSVRGYTFQSFTIACTQPVGLAAGEPEARAP